MKKLCCQDFLWKWPTLLNAVVCKCRSQQMLCPALPWLSSSSWNLFPKYFWIFTEDIWITAMIISMQGHEQTWAMLSFVQWRDCCMSAMLKGKWWRQVLVYIFIVISYCFYQFRLFNCFVSHCCCEITAQMRDCMGMFREGIMLYDLLSVTVDIELLTLSLMYCILIQMRNVCSWASSWRHSFSFLK